MSRAADAVIIGSGHNALVAAAYLARAGWSVEVIERAARPGGAVISEELTQAGYVHDTFSSWHPLFHTSGAWAELGDELRARGLDYVNFDDVVTATARRDGSSVVAHRDPERTATELDPVDGQTYLRELGELEAQMPVLGELLSTELQSARAARLVATLAKAMGVRGGLEFTARTVASARGWLTERFAGPQLGDLLAPWVLHTGLTPDDAGGAFPMLALAGGLHEVGLPVVRGGSSRFTEAFVRLVEDYGGAVRCGTEVERIVVSSGRAVGVIAGAEEIRARRAVIANTTPTQLYGRLLERRPGSPRGSRPGRSLPLRTPLGYPGAPSPIRATSMARRSPARRGGDRPRDGRDGRRFACLRTGRRRSAARQADDRVWPADRRRSEPAPDGSRAAVDPATGGPTTSCR